MLKLKTTIPKNTILWGLVALLVVAGIITLTISFRGAGATADDVSVVYTNAAATLEAQQLTLQAAEPTATPAFTLTPTITMTPFATLTGFIQTGLASPTTSLSSGGAVGCDNSVFVTDVTIPDGTQMTPGQAFTKTWRLQNNGTCPWTTAYKLSFVSGDAMGGNAVNLTRTVNPGESVDIAVPMTAPAAPGQARGDWRLVNASGQQFGTFVYVIINVGTTTGTSTTAAPTATTGAPSATPVTPSPTEDIPPTEENGG
jgi:hypothetical protein